jgi:hypothetical protein
VLTLAVSAPGPASRVSASSSAGGSVAVSIAPVSQGGGAARLPRPANGEGGI